MNLATSSLPGTTPRDTRRCDRLASALLVIVGLIAAFTFNDYGLGWDDYTHAEYGALLLELYGSGFADQRALSFVNLYAYGGGFDMFAALVAKISPFDLWETRRMCGAIVGLIGLATTWRIGRRIGGPLAGLIALALLATCPLFYGHMFMNAKDAPFAAAMAIALLSLVRVFEEYPRPGAPAVALVGVGFGLAFGTRILGGLSGVYAVIALAFMMMLDGREYGPRKTTVRAGKFLVTLIPAAVLAYATMALVWPWGVTAPLNPLRAVEYFSHFFEKPWRELFAGDLIQVPDMPRSYLPTLLTLKLPEIFLLLGLGGIVCAIVAVARPSRSPQRRAMLLVTLLAAITPVAIAVAERPAMYNGLRHFVFIMPPLAALAGYFGSTLIGWIAARTSIGAGVAAALIAIGMAFPVAEMIRLHPYEYVHFNHLAGGLRGANSRYMRDYWGLSFKQLSEDFLATLAARKEQKPADRRWRMAVCGPHRPAQVELGPDFDISWNPRGGDFVMALGEFYCVKLNAPIVTEIVRDGVSLARVYDIRGRNFTNLLTIPAPE